MAFDPNPFTPVVSRVQDQPVAQALVGPTLPSTTISPAVHDSLKRTWITYDIANWDRVFKYYFRVYNDSSGDSSAPGWSEFKQLNGGYYYFEVAPSSIRVGTPFAISLVATNGGVLEEGAGVVFRNISISGSTGVLPNREVFPISPGLASKFSSVTAQLFPTAIGALNGVVAAATKVSSDIQKGATPPNPLMYPGGQLDTASLFPGTSTIGYAKANELANFLTSYAEIKKGDKDGTLRLAFGSPKENVEYVCSPVTFDLDKDSASPLSYRYSISLKSWAVQLPGITAQQQSTVTLPTPANANLIKQIASTLSDARNVITAAQGVLTGVKSDLLQITQVYTQALLCVKSAGGVAQSLLDFQSTFSNNPGQAGAAFAATLASAWAAGQASTGTTVPASASFVTLPAAENAAPATLTLSPLGGRQIRSAASAPNGIGGETPAPSQSFVASQQKALLLASLANPSIADAISPYAANLPASLQAKLAAALATAQSTSPDVVQKLLASLQGTSDNLAQSIGQMDPTYAMVQGLPPPAAGRAATDDDIIAMAALQDAKAQLGYVLAGQEIFVERQPDPFVGADEDLQSDDQMPSPLSYYAGTVLQGDDLEALSLRFLGDPLRWRELAVLNNLRAPYIDEAGSNVAVLSASGNGVVVADASGLPIGLSVRVQTAGGGRGAPRTILNVQPIGPNSLVTLDGNPNLATQAGMSLWARQPGTVGSGDTIFIPTGAGPDTDVPPDRDTALQRAMTAAERAFKVDIQLDPVTGDIVFSQGGDFALSFGYANAQQALSLLVTTGQGELEWAPGYGLPITVGSRNSDLNPSKAQAALAAQVTADPRFSLASADIVRNGSEVDVNLVAGGREGSALIPVTFQVGLAPS